MHLFLSRVSHVYRLAFAPRLPGDDSFKSELTGFGFGSGIVPKPYGGPSRIIPEFEFENLE